MNYLNIDKKYVWHPYNAIPTRDNMLAVKETYQQTIVLEDGRKLTDAMSSWWSAIHGYNHPELIKALNIQAKKMPHIMFGGLTHQPASLLCETLAELTKLPSIFLADSGSVAVEVALKTAILYQKAKNKKFNNKSVSKFIALENAYHGDTLGCMGVCDPKNSMHSLYGDYLPQNIFTSISNLENTINKHYKEVVGVIIEPIVQGAGGMLIHNEEYLKIARKLCTQYDLVLIIDEIATGFGHTGTMFASEHANIIPDIMTVGKSLTGGIMTLSAMCVSKNISDTISNSDIGVLMHGPTFMGNALACSVANKSIELLLNSDWKNRVKNINYIFSKELKELNNLDIVEEVRTIGAIAVVELTNSKHTTNIQNICVDNGVWIRPFGKLIYSIVAYTITDEELYKITNAIKKAINLIL
jgi:adenosylmethionine-8-amino-7-oxononanoate aminotransferase